TGAREKEDCGDVQKWCQKVMLHWETALLFSSSTRNTERFPVGLTEPGILRLVSVLSINTPLQLLFRDAAGEAELFLKITQTACWSRTCSTSTSALFSAQFCLHPAAAPHSRSADFRNKGPHKMEQNAHALSCSTLWNSRCTFSS
ncbi:MAG: uncharacterized protein A8A55_2166, partial [Amphiamblys sp. WSBS2006]